MAHESITAQSPTTPQTLQLRSVNLGTAAPLHTDDRTVLSAIRKTATHQTVAVGRLGLQGDEQVNLSVHGGLDKAVYAFPVEHYAFWQHERQQHQVGLLGEALPMGYMGENLSIAGLLESDVYVGDELLFPHCRLRVTAPREPCFKFNAVMGFAQAAKRMVQTGHCGFYLAVDQPGSLRAGESFSLIPGRRSLNIQTALRTKMAKHAN